MRIDFGTDVVTPPPPLSGVFGRTIGMYEELRRAINPTIWDRVDANMAADTRVRAALERIVQVLDQDSVPTDVEIEDAIAEARAALALKKEVSGS